MRLLPPEERLTINHPVLCSVGLPNFEECRIVINDLMAKFCFILFFTLSSQGERKLKKKGSSAPLRTPKLSYVFHKQKFEIVRQNPLYLKAKDF